MATVNARARRPSLLRRLACGAVMAAAVATPVLAQADTKVAVIDLRRAVVETEDGLRVQARLKQLFDHRQTDLDELQKGFQQAQLDFEKDKKNPNIAKDLLAKKDVELKRQAVELQNKLVEYQNEMRRQESEATMPIVQRMMVLLRRLASQGNYDLVLDKAAVPYFRSDLDVTDRIIQMYNSGDAASPTTPNKGETPPTAPPPAAPSPAPAPKK